MIPLILSREADAAAARYGDFLETLRSIHDRALRSTDLFKAGFVRRIAAEAFAAGQRFMDREAELVDRAVEKIATDAHQRVRVKIESIAADELTDAALEHVSATQTHLRDELVTQINRDIATLRQSLHRTALEVSLAARVRQIPDRRALIEHLVANERPLEFHFVDRRARRAQSRIFVRAAWRLAMLSAHNEAVLMEMAEHGLDTATIHKLENGVAKQVGFVSVSGQDYAPAYGAIRAVTFHPNSNAWLGLEDDDV